MMELNPVKEGDLREVSDTQTLGVGHLEAPLA
jgi:hypothetical protein